MKTRSAVFAVLGAACFYFTNASAILPPEMDLLPNMDKREQNLARQSQFAAPFDSGRNAAEAVLKTAIPDIRISRDKILGTPSQIATTRGFLTGPGGAGRTLSASSLAAFPANDNHRVIKAFLNEHSALFGHNADLLASARISRDYVAGHNGMRTTVWEQVVDGIPVFESLIVGHITRNEELVNISSRFVPQPVQAASKGTPNRTALASAPVVSAISAVLRAATNINVSITEKDVVLAGSPEGTEKKQSAQASGLPGTTDIRLVWLPLDGESMRLCWRVILGSQAPMGHYMVLVDAETGEVLVRRSLTSHSGPASYNVFTSDSPAPFSPGWPTPQTGQPTNVARTMVTFSALDTNASPAGWIPDGENSTDGNNARAFLDRDFDGTADVALPQGTGPDRVFDYPLDLSSPPLSYASASTVQLFYRANWYHDRLYQLGFTEAAGNFQVDNFGRGGFGNDNIICLVQAGADVGEANNAFFSTFPDGLNSYCAMFIFTGPSPDRDGSLDQEVVVHEMTHGLSNRLLGGGPGISALQSAGMGEGWSDFYALCLLSEESDPLDGVYATGGYATYRLGGFDFEENYYFGIRRYPYSVDMTKNPLTFKDIDPVRASDHLGVPINPIFGGGDPSEVHNQGEVWCMTLWEVRVNLVSKLGWALGNELALQLVTDGLKLAPANATYLEARDAILQADLVNTGGDNFIEIWTGFAKRGMGYSAICPTSDTTTGVIEAYDLPPELGTPDGVLEIKITPPDFEAMFAGETNSIFVRVSDALPIVDATVTAPVSGGEVLSFVNDGVAPDVLASNSVYSASLIVPSNQTSIQLTFVISAPDKETATNTVTYFIVPLPSNDNFANATKVPAVGTNYLTNNKRATLETNEPVHAAISSSKASLWWDFTPSVNTNVLIDTGASLVRTVIGVYTNNNLAGLKPIASAAGNLVRPGAFVNFAAKAGVTYHIAVAGYDSANAGTLNVLIAPGVQADTNAPTVTIASPLNGQVVTTNRLTVTGSAFDPSPNASGIREITLRVIPVPGVVATTTTVVPSSLSGPLNTNWISIVGLQPGLNSVQVSATDFSGNKSVAAAIEVTYRVIEPLNDFFINASPLTGSAGTNSVNTIQATKQAGEPNHAGVFGGRSVWWSFTPSGDGLLTLSTEGSTFDTVLALYSGTNLAQLIPLQSNDDAFAGVPGGYSQIVQVVRSNQNYRIALDGYDGQSGAAFLSYHFEPSAVYRVTAVASEGGSVTPASIDVLSNTVVILNAVANPNYTFDVWSGGIVSAANPLELTVTTNIDLTATFRPVQFTDGFETGDLLQLPWTFSGSKPWIVQSEVRSAGSFAARSGNIAHSQSSSLILYGSFRKGNGSFAFRVNSEQNFDFLRFYVDGSLQQQWSGNVGWDVFVFALEAGNHTLEWRYSKDSGGVSGLDAAFIDSLALPLKVPTNDDSAPTLALMQQSDGGIFIDILGQTNQQYVLQASTNLFDWWNLSTNVASGGFFRFVESENVATNTVRFYRAVALP